jgi:protein O-mannosyl-transferase
LKSAGGFDADELPQLGDGRWHIFRSPMIPRSKTLSAALPTLLAVTLTYSNHFHNGFQFDDYHSITDNIFVRSLANVPRFFVDATMSSAYSTHQTWRPLVMASLALDYQLGKGYEPFYFHLSTFLWFLTLLICAALLFETILNKVAPDPRNPWIAWFAAAWYGLHPAMAETVNYIIQRADLMSTWGIVAGLAVYARFPAWRRRGLYLLPVAVGFLSKPTTFIFPALLAAYILLIEEGASRNRLGRVVRRTLPALALTAGFILLQLILTPKSFAPGSISAYRYLITQPYVWFRYFTSFVLPVHLNADSDLSPVQSIFGLESVGGFLFIAALVFLIYVLSRHPGSRPVAFGLAWFALGSIPTSVFPLAEVENDHRMFLPFVGLALASGWSVSWIARREQGSREIRVGITVGALCLLVLLAAGTRRRNEVWRTPESLWEDVTLKSPRNGRGLMNYGLARMSAGDFPMALTYFESARRYTPNYPKLEINLGIDYGALGRDAEAEQHFRRAVEVAPTETEGHFYYARWLRSQGRDDQAIGELQSAITLNPVNMNARLLLLQIYADRGLWGLLKPLVLETLKLVPGDPEALRFARMQPLQAATVLPPPTLVPETLLSLSLKAYQNNDFEGSIRFAQMALKLRPDYVQAYNNIMAANNSLGRWDEAIQAGRKALGINPDYQLARNNLRWAESQKMKHAGQAP